MTNIMRLFIYSIFLVMGLSFSNCSSQSNDSENSSNEISEYDGFKFKKENFNDFIKQADPINENDTAYESYAIVEQYIKDSLIINNEKKEVLVFGVLSQFYNRNLAHNLRLKYKKNDSIIWRTTEEHRFLPLLEAVKQIKYKSKYIPKNPIHMQYGNNNIIVEVQYQPDHGKWERYLLLLNAKTDSIEFGIALKEELFDSLIYKMDKIRSEIL